MKKQLAILGSTGSIGTQTLQVVEDNPDLFEVYAITANNRAEELIEQARKFQPEVVVIANEQKYDMVKEALADLPMKVYTGADALCQIVEAKPIDVVVTAMVGFAGLPPTISAIKAGKTIALANKETLVVAGELINSLAQQYNVAILPVDSEHSAIFQSIVGEVGNNIEKILLTASGGPFRKFSIEQLATVTKEQALKHPNWEMGAKITIDSATMMNKGFEAIEAKWLFGVKPEHMRLPIQYALTYPDRIKANFDRLDLFKLGSMTFEKPDLQKFRCLALAYEAMDKGGNMPCIVNAANEIVNLAFRQDKIGFLRIGDIIAETMQKASFIEKPTYEDYVATDAEARRIATEML